MFEMPVKTENRLCDFCVILKYFVHMQAKANCWPFTHKMVDKLYPILFYSSRVQLNLLEK